MFVWLAAFLWGPPSVAILYFLRRWEQVTILWQIWRSGVPGQGIRVLDSLEWTLPFFPVSGGPGILNDCITPVSDSICIWPFPLCPSSPVPYWHSSLNSGPHLGNPGCSHLKNINLITCAHTVFSKEDKILPQAHIIITLIYFYVRCNKCLHNNFYFQQSWVFTPTAFRSACTDLREGPSRFTSCMLLRMSPAHWLQWLLEVT